jgi:parvulin-like peptidyl-prolyl isomerase
LHNYFNPLLVKTQERRRSLCLGPRKPNCSKSQLTSRKVGTLSARSDLDLDNESFLLVDLKHCNQPSIVVGVYTCQRALPTLIHGGHSRFRPKGPLTVPVKGTKKNEANEAEALKAAKAKEAEALKAAKAKEAKIKEAKAKDAKDAKAQSTSGGSSKGSKRN